MTVRIALCAFLLTAASIAQTRPQPDEILLNHGISDVQHDRYERARLVLQTLINTYYTSPLIPKARLVMAESWYRQGGPHGLAQAQMELKDLIADFPDSPTAAEARKLLHKIQEPHK